MSDKDGNYDAWIWMPRDFKELVMSYCRRSGGLGELVNTWHNQMMLWEGQPQAFEQEFPAFRARIEKPLLLGVLARKEGQ